MFRQQYNEDVKKLLRRGKKGPSPTPVQDDPPPRQSNASPVVERTTPSPVPNQQPPAHSPRGSAMEERGRESVIKKPTTAASPTQQAVEEQARTEAANIGVIQAVTVVSPQNVKRINNKPKTVDSVNVVNVKKSPVIVKSKHPA